MVVHSADGLDEISIAEETHVAELVNGTVSEYTIKPEDFSLTRQPLTDILVEDTEQSLAMLSDALDNQPGAARDIVALNAGAAIYISGMAGSMADGVAKAQEVLASGAALGKLDALREKTQA